MPTPRKTAATKEAVLPGPDTPSDGPAPVSPGDPTVAHIGTAQMRQLHGLLRNHGITTDTAVYGYLSLHLGREVTSRRTITATEAAGLIRDLEAAPVILGTEQLRALREPFTGEAIGKLPRVTCKACRDDQRKHCEQHSWVTRCNECGNSHSYAAIHLDFVGHADVTARLLEVDPAWTWRPFNQEEVMSLSPKMREAGLWIMLTVCGVTRPGFGDADGKSGGNAVKEAIGDALRNSSMRFGVALELWAKGDRTWAHSEDRDSTGQAPPEKYEVRRADGTVTRFPADDGPTYQADEYDDMGTPDLLLVIDTFAEKAGKTYADFTDKFRNDNGGMTVDAMDDLPPEPLRVWVRQVEKYFETVGT